MGQLKDSIKQRVLRRLIGSDARRILLPTTLEEERAPVVREELMPLVAQIIEAVVEEMVSETEGQN
jgi:hypothetical protein